jgi:hypothetical protein
LNFKLHKSRTATHWQARLIYLLALVITLSLGACSDTEVSNEDALKQLLATASVAAEERSHDRLLELVDDQFSAQKGLDKKQLSRLIRGYLFRHKNIFLFSKIKALEFLADDRALLSIHVAMTGSKISDLGALANLRARIYRMDLELVKKDSTWLLIYADWQPAGLSDFE